jgi:hypothetical protein
MVGLVPGWSPDAGPAVAMDRTAAGPQKSVVVHVWLLSPISLAVLNARVCTAWIRRNLSVGVLVELATSSAAEKTREPNELCMSVSKTKS